MTNQEVNQIYWALPKHCQLALDLMLSDGEPGTAALLLVDLAGCKLQCAVTSQEAEDWATWRVTLRHMTGRD